MIRKLFQWFLVPRNFAEASGWAVAAIVVFGAFFMQISAAWKYPYFVPTSNLEEAAYTHIIVRNFIELGFWNSGFLQDVASSFRPEDHPFVYNHMPPGHEILIAFLTKWFDGNQRLVNLIMFGFVPLGFVFYVLFIRRLLREINVVGAGFIAIFIFFQQLIVNTSHPHTSPFLLLMFLPFLIVAWANDGQKMWLKWSAWLMLLAASWILDYVLLSAVMASWILLWATRLWRLSGRDVVWALAVIVLGIVLHLLRNLLYLGPDIFFTELAYVLGNRLFGYPSAAAVADFYQNAAILHHGSRPISPWEMAGVLRANFLYPGGLFLVLAAMAGLLSAVMIWPGAAVVRMRLAPSGRKFISFLVRVSVWVTGTLLTPVMLFPAFAQDMSLSGLAHSYFLAIPFLVIALWVSGNIIGHYLIRNKGALGELLSGKTLNVRARFGGFRLAWKAGLAGLVVIMMLPAFLLLARDRIHYLKEYRTLYVQKDINESFRYLEELRRYSDGLFMTNVNTPIIGFLTRQPGFGGCGLTSITSDGIPNLERCKIALTRNVSRYRQEQPKYFFFFTEKFSAFPGFATCRPLGKRLDEESKLLGEDCHNALAETLEERFPAVYTANEVIVYDLSPRQGR